ncbi:PREDICTED: X-box-binding protein 1-like [Priapulus caudatus]|uniref:X-box-binding protein 1 n=1 Tax=Priapulus caudatus TaxID=37621 RepID=A0ABM1F223_PRICU|nr:PREDICTED: X-box-binding protein 1-like [Priapulus caudatus]
MSMTKTIIITGVPRAGSGNLPAIRSASLVKKENMDFGNNNNSSLCVARKRQRLTNLSPNEKLLRRKMKNREAAQTARDRKKERMDTLEDALTALQAQNKALKSENVTFRLNALKLKQENAELRHRLELPSQPAASSGERACAIEGSAASTKLPLQQEQACRLSLSMTSLPALLTLLSMMFCLSSSDVLRAKVRAGTRPALRARATASQERALRQLAPHCRWWGRHQRSWNPAMNS